MIKKIFKLALCFAKKYYYKIYDNYQNPFSSFKFLLTCLFSSKKKNELVDYYVEFVIKELKFYRYQYDNLYDILSAIPITRIKEQLKTPMYIDSSQKKTIKLNDADVKMIINVLEFILEKKIDNIYNFLSNEIQKSVKNTYYQLKEICGIEDKTAAFIIRNFLLLKWEIFIDAQDYRYAFPVDGWIKTIAKSLNPGLTKNIKKFLIDQCQENHFDPIEINTGLWYIGYSASNLVARYFKLYLSPKKAREFLLSNFDDFWDKLSLKEKIENSTSIERLKYFSNPNIPIHYHMPDIKDSLVSCLLHRELDQALYISNNSDEAAEKAIKSMEEKYQIKLYYYKTNDIGSNSPGVYKTRIYKVLDKSEIFVFVMV